MGGVSAKDVDGYFASIPEDARAALRHAWGAIRHERRRRQANGGIDP
jgi:hypothetical protein